VLNRLFLAVLRLRKAIVVAQLPLAATYIAVDVPRGGEVGKALFPWSVGITLVAGLLAWQAGLRFRPAALVRRGNPPSFEAPTSPVPVLAFTALLPFVTEQVSTTVDRVAKQIDPWWLDILTSALSVLALTVLVRAVWTGFGVRLRPDGLVDRRPARSLFVPWESFAAITIPPPSSRRAVVTLAYNDPSLVRGAGRKVITAMNVDSRFLARAIQEYVNHPEHRSAIGTPAELQRLNTAAADQPAGPGRGR